MTISQIEAYLKALFENFDKTTFIYELMLAYGVPKASITRLQKGNLNISKNEGEISWKKKVIFREEYQQDLHAVIDNLTNEVTHNQRFVIVTDYESLLAEDTITKEKLDIKLTDLPKHYDFFLPWAGMEKAAHQNENPADVKAAEKMAKLFDEIKVANPAEDQTSLHSLNVFLSRLLFCFFAEDTGIFEEAQFTNAIDRYTQADGTDLHTFLDRLFVVMDTKETERGELPQYLNDFPYVNGGLFRAYETIQAPVFNRKSRQAIIASGELNWSAINPDIFGSMFQGVIHPDKRGSLGAHYTSVPNIMKVIEPLFLNDLKESYEQAKNEPKKLKELLARLSKIKIFDPACGSGNFLIIAYTELRKLEIAIIQRLAELKSMVSSFGAKSEQLSFIPKSQLSLAASFEVELFSRIHLSQFYGIELDDFAHEIAQLGLWLAEHQMHMEFKKAFGSVNPTLPLQEAGKIVCGNACRIDWEDVCPKAAEDEIYILGNPPYLGARVQTSEQKYDLDIVFRSKLTKYRDLDYIACWFFKGAEFIYDSDSKLAFVSTNSINQGLQVGLLWPSIFNLNIEIFFAHTSFKWTNNAKANAAVVVAIVGLSKKSTSNKIVYSNNFGKTVKNINAYLSTGSSTIVNRRSNSLSYNFQMSFGNMPNDGGALILSSEEKENLIKEYPNSIRFIRKFVGAAEFIKGVERFCLWIENEDYENALSIPPIANRINDSKKHRRESKDSGTNNLASRPHQFRDRKTANQIQIIVPSVSSERRNYIPCGYLDKMAIVSNSAQVIYDPETWLLAILSSQIHMVWVRNVGGKLETRYRYAKDLVYNTFPFPSISAQRKQELTECAFRILEERENHPEKTLAQLYDPDKMPLGLREAHRQNDLAVERCYRPKPFESDEERLEYLFKLYEQMIEEEKNKNTLFEQEKKKRKKRIAKK